MSVYQSKVEIGREQISIETGKWAKQAHGSVVYRVGNLVLLGTVCASKDAREDQDFFPLTVDYREKLYAVGRFPGGYIKRENRPADHETLLSRMIDRPIRPLFPEGYFSEVQLLITVISADANSCIEGHAITAASAALMVSDIPFHGPIAGVVVGRIDGEFILNPTTEELEKSDLELIVAGSRDAVTMIEGGSTEFSNEEMLSAIQFAHDKIKGMLNFQEELAKEIGIPKREIIQRLPDPKVLELVREYAYEKMKAASQNSDKATREAMVSGLYKETVDYFKGKIESDPAGFGFVSIKDVKNFLHEIEADVVRTQIFEKKIRADGRALDEIRDISVELDVLPGAHGSAVFTRGQTQSLGVATLGTPSDNQRYENLSGQKTKNFMLHYNFPPFSVGEVKRMAGPGRREIGHGNLAERAIARMLPVNTEFPYVIRLVSEILESNGSSSMASVCSGSLALMAAGVPIKNSVSGIAMGLITNKDGRFAILSDIAGIEDHFGDMDFKVAGTKKGITALQLDIKVTGISMEVMREALEQASKGRDHILGKMDEVLADARSTIPRNAPRITSLQIDPERIGELIGPGGKMIRSIIEKSGADINVDDTGTVLVSSVDSSSSELACQMIQDIFREVEVGTIYEGVVKKIADFGAFVEILPGKEGLCHISKLDVQRVNSVRDIVNEGDAITVKVIGVDRQGRIDLSRKDVLDPNSSQGGNGDEGRRDGDNGRGRPGGRDDSRERRPMNRPRR